MYGSRNLTANCPECDYEFAFNRRPKLGEFAFCRECETTLEVIEVEPIIKLDWYFEEPFNEDEDEDYDDDYEDDEYDDDYEDDEYDDDYEDEEYEDKKNGVNSS